MNKGDAYGPRYPALRPEPASRLGHSAGIAIAVWRAVRFVFIMPIAAIVALVWMGQ